MLAQVLGDELGRGLALVLVGHVGRDRLDAQEVEQPLEALVEVGVDLVEHGGQGLGRRHDTCSAAVVVQARPRGGRRLNRSRDGDITARRAKEESRTRSARFASASDPPRNGSRNWADELPPSRIARRRKTSIQEMAAVVSPKNSDGADRRPAGCPGRRASMAIAERQKRESKPVSIAHRPDPSYAPIACDGETLPHRQSLAGRLQAGKETPHQEEIEHDERHGESRLSARSTSRATR